jgi:hypothetical protein
MEFAVVPFKAEAEVVDMQVDGAEVDGAEVDGAEVDGAEVDDWLVVEANDDDVEEVPNFPIYVVVFLWNFHHLFDLLELIGNNYSRIIFSPHEPIRVVTGFCDVVLPPGIFVVLLDSNSVDLSAIETQLTSRLVFPVRISESFWRQLARGSNLRMMGLLMSRQLVYPPFHQWHFLEPLYREAGLRFPRSLGLIVREHATSTLGIFAMQLTQWLGQLLKINS